MRRNLVKTEAIGQRIRLRRKELGLTLQAVSELVGVTRAAVSQWENGDTNISAENLLKLTLVLRANPFELMGIHGISVGNSGLDVSRLSSALETLESFLSRKKLLITPHVKAKVLSYLCDSESHSLNDREIICLIELAKPA